jgi:hypothetical protein
MTEILQRYSARTGLSELICMLTSRTTQALISYKAQRLLLLHICFWCNEKYAFLTLNQYVEVLCSLCIYQL